MLLSVEVVMIFLPAVSHLILLLLLLLMLSMLTMSLNKLRLYEAFKSYSLCLDKVLDTGRLYPQTTPLHCLQLLCSHFHVNKKSATG